MNETGASRARIGEESSSLGAGLRVLLVNPRQDSLPSILQQLGFTIAAQAADGRQADMLCRVADPDVALVDCRDAPGYHPEYLNRQLPADNLPLVVLWDGGPPPPGGELSSRGVYSCLLGDWEPQALAGALEAAHRGFGQQRGLKRRAEALRGSLAQRKLVGRATGLLMDREGLTEAQALARLRDRAGETGESLARVAEAVIQRLEVRRAPRRRLVRPGGKGSRPG